MARKRLILLISVIAFAAISFTVLNSANGRQCPSTGDCPSSNMKEDKDQKSSSGTMIWEALSRQLVASARQ